MTIQITCKCGYSRESADWNSAGPPTCPQCGDMLQKSALTNEVSNRTAPRGTGPTVPASTMKETKLCPFCGGEILLAAIKCKHCGEMLNGQGDASSNLDPDIAVAEYEEIKRKRKVYNLLSFAFALPGFVSAAIPQYVKSSIASAVARREPPNDIVMFLIDLPLGLFAIAGIVLLGTGFVFYAKYKGRSPLWGLCGFLSCLGILVLAILKDVNAQRMRELKSELAVMGRRV